MHPHTDLPDRGAAPRRSWLRRLRVPIAASAVLIAAGAVFAVIPGASAAVPFAVESLDGSANNVANPTFGQANRPYARVGTAHYADGISTMNTSNAPRNSSNRIINDVHQNVFSERRVTQWGWTWGQFLDHTFGLRQDTGAGATAANIPFNAADPQEEFTNNLGTIPFTRSATAPGTGTSTANPRQQTNTLASYINASAVYGTDNARLDWLRDGSNDGNPTNNNATLMLPGGFLPRKTARGNPATAPAMETVGRLLANPNNAAVAGDKRANENIALTGTHTLFAREHNRIVGLLPNTLSQEDKFQIARRVVVAEQQYITYNEWLPAMGVALPRYTGYKSNINTALSTEFATIGYRAHSQIHGEFEVEVETGHYTAAQLAGFEAQGIEVAVDGDETALAIPLNVAFSNPDLLTALGEGPTMAMLGAESQYNNDENIDNSLRSILMQIPVSSNPDCLDGETMSECFNGVNDLGAIDIQRGLDHGIGTYNQLRQAYGLPAKTSFTAITGEATDQFPAGLDANNPASLEVTQLFDIDGNPINLADEVAVEGTATRDVRRSTVASRLRAVYGNVNNIDAFTGMISEAHVNGTEFGELQLAIWTREFTRLRDGDRFYIGNDQGLSTIKSTYGIDYRRSLSQIIRDNTSDVDDDEISNNVFLTPDDDLPATTCSVEYKITTSWPGHFQVNMFITNTGTTPINGWTLNMNFYNGQSVYDGWGGTYTATGPNGRDVSLRNASYNGTIAVGQRLGDIGFNALADDFANAKPPNVSINGKRCAVPLT